MVLFLKGDLANCSLAKESFQSAIKSWVFPSVQRLEVQTNFFPSGEKTGNPSNLSVYVTLTGSLQPFGINHVNFKICDNPVYLKRKQGNRLMDEKMEPNLGIQNQSIFFHRFRQHSWCKHRQYVHLH